VTAAVILLALLTAERLSELVIARRNGRALIAQGGYEAGAGHYPWMVAMHAAWLACLWWLAPGQPVNWVLAGIAMLLQAGRFWVIATLAGRWTTRIIVLPGIPPVTGGPFRFMRHPNYAIVVAEIAVVPLTFGLWQVALLFSVLNAVMLAVRIRAEERALAAAARQDPLPTTQSATM
jgi:methyltransferase